MPDSIGDRMKKNYEDRNRVKLTRRTPVIIRLDGRAFHTLTRNMDKPFDMKFIRLMGETARKMAHSIQGAKVVYVQSDEISVLLTDYDELDTNAWFDYNVQKMCSVSASIASVHLSMALNKPVEFDSRCFNIPKEEVINYFRWRYGDWVKNSVQMLARSKFSQKELNGKKQADMHEMLHQKGINWADLPGVCKNGRLLWGNHEIDDFNLKDAGWISWMADVLTPQE